MSARLEVKASSTPEEPAETGPAVTADMRKAALLLHSLPQSDRLWLIARLPKVEQGVVRGLLGELEGLGIPADRELLGEVLDPKHERPVPSPRGEHGAPSPVTRHEGERRADVEVLERASLADLVRLLREEPSGLIAQLLLVRPWPWGRDLVKQLAPLKRHQVEDLVRRQAGSSRTACEASLESGALLRARIVSIVASRLARPAATEARREGYSRPVRARAAFGSAAWLRSRLGGLVWRFTRP